MLIGAHISIANGLAAAFNEGERIGATAIQIFLKNARSWSGKQWTSSIIDTWHSKRVASSIQWMGAHAAYLINLASPRERVRTKSLLAIQDEIKRAEQLGISTLVLHPGSAGRGQIEQGIPILVQALNRIHEVQSSVNLTLETTANPRSSIGSTLEQLHEICSQCKHPHRLRFCVDTAHISAAGYDWRTEDGYHHFWNQFDTLLGISNLAVIHTNDNYYPIGKGKDRHVHLGEGSLGEYPFQLLMTDIRMENIPKILETPKDERFADEKNLSRLKQWALNS
jgi:deoxyribonuclease IV